MKKLAIAALVLTMAVCMMGCRSNTYSSSELDSHTSSEDGSGTSSETEEKPVDKSGLKNIIDSTSDVDPSEYTDESAEVFTTALTKANDILAKEDATNTEVVEAITNLISAQGGLVKRIDPVVINGSGDDVVEIPTDLEVCLVAAQHSGSRNFSIWSLDENMENVDLLVNTIGNYKGTTTTGMGHDTARYLQVEGDGEWAITLSPLSDARQIKNGEKCEGDDVVFIDASDAKKLDIKNNGDSNFSVWAFSSSDSDLLVNEIGSYSGTVPNKGYSLFVVNSEGTWSISW